ncbi:MAG: signal peptidase I [Planctomycetota bacterium]|jgi:signal peptidase I
MHRRRNLLLLLALLAGGCALMVWAWQPYRVIGPSMEPGLVEGDWLFLDHSTPQRDDLVVFHEPGTGKLVVKRVAGIPGESVQLVDGNLYLDGEVHRRSLASVEDLVPMLDVRGDAAGKPLRLEDHGFEPAEGDYWRLEGSGVAFLQRPPSADYLLDGVKVPGEHPATDLGLEVEFDLLSAESQLHLVLRKGTSTLIAELSAQGRTLNILLQTPIRQEAEVLFALDLEEAHPHGALFFTLADHGITVTLNDEILITGLPYPTPEPTRNSELPPDFSNFEHAGVGGIGPLLVGRIRLGRDILYRSTGTYGGAEAFHLADGQYFLLGDNPTQSRDSRQYGAVPSERIVGTVLSRAWPRGRTERGWPVD